MITYLHTMIRTSSPEDSLRFYCEGLGLKLTRKSDYEEDKFSLYFLGENDDGPQIELTHNWGDREYSNGDQFGHLAFGTDDVYSLCEHLMSMGVTILRPPKEGRMAFIKDPNGISIELLQQGEALTPCEPWTTMGNTGSW